MMFSDFVLRHNVSYRSDNSVTYDVYRRAKVFLRQAASLAFPDVLKTLFCIYLS